MKTTEANPTLHTYYDDSELHSAMLRRLHNSWRGLSTIEEPDLGYWAERFCGLNIRFFTNCSFQQYLNQPSGWEDAARVVRGIVSKSPAMQLVHQMAGGRIRSVRVAMN